MPATPQTTFDTDGSLDWSEGVDSITVPTMASARNPNGLKRNQLAWLDNGTVRDGGISPRVAYKLLGAIHNPNGLFQGAFTYQPDFGNPYLLVAISGHIYKVDPDNMSNIVDLSAQFNVFHPATQPYYNFEQAEQFVIIQAGDGVTLPLFWDGALLRRSRGLSNPSVPTTSYSLTTTLGWVIPAQGGVVTVNLTAPYQGNVGDTLTWAGYGTFTVSQISGNSINLVTVSSAQAGITVPPNVYVVNVAAGPPSATYTVTTTANTTVAQVNTTLSCTLSAPYAGNVGDTIQWIGVGTFVILGLSSTKHRVSLLVTFNQVGTGATIVAGTYTWGATPPLSPSPNVTTEVTTTNSALVGGTGWTFSLTLTAPFTGSLGDTLYWIQINSFGVANCTVVSISAGGLTVGLVVTLNIAGGGTYGAGNYIFVDVPVLAPSMNTPAFVPEIPAATTMDYFMGRLWYAIGRTYQAGDIVQGPSGTAQYNQRDSVLKVTENPLAINGDGFTVPDVAGDITALAHSSQIDASLGQGRLFISTLKKIYAQYVPVTRSLWTQANGANGPLQIVALDTNGGVNDRCFVSVNSDLYFQSLEPGIRSILLATRYFDQPGNIMLSAAETRVMNFYDQNLLGFISGVFFDNRLLMTGLPVQLPQGVVHKAVVPLDYIPMSTFGAVMNPIWEGMHEGLQILQLCQGVWGTNERSFATAVASSDGTIQLWELIPDGQFDTNASGQSRIQWQIEFPCFTWGREFDLKKLVGAEFWLDRIFGEVIVQTEYRPDGVTCWQPWHTFKVCSARNTCEDVVNPSCYPEEPYGEDYRQLVSLPKPPVTCANTAGRPTNVGCQFQLRVTIKGFCRFRGLQLMAEPVQRSLYEFLVCKWNGVLGLLDRLIG